MFYIDTIIAVVAVLAAGILFFRAMNRSWFDAVAVCVVYLCMTQMSIDGLDLAYVGVLTAAVAAPLGRLVGNAVLEDEVLPEFLKSLKSM